jgi:hypothetical protein
VKEVSFNKFRQHSVSIKSKGAFDKKSSFNSYRGRIPFQKIPSGLPDNKIERYPLVKRKILSLTAEEPPFNKAFTNWLF